MSCHGDGVEDGARIRSILHSLGLPHDGRHSTPCQVPVLPEMGVGRNFKDKLAKIHGLAPKTREAISQGMGFSNMSTRTSSTFSRCLAKACTAKLGMQSEHGISRSVYVTGYVTCCNLDSLGDFSKTDGKIIRRLRGIKCDKNQSWSTVQSPFS